MTNKSAQIRDLAKAGLSVRAIADRLGISYQFAYNVLSKAGAVSATRGSARTPSVPNPAKPSLSVEELAAGGFELSSFWLKSSDGKLELSAPMPKKSGVYIFCHNGEALYIGVTLRTLAERMVLYRNAHTSQPTNVVMRDKLLNLLNSVDEVPIYTASPSNSEWNGWPVHTSAGLEVALISKYLAPWNRKGI